MWDSVVPGKSILFQVNIRRRLQEMRCAEGEDIKSHLTDMSRLHQELAGMGVKIEDNDM